MKLGIRIMPAEATVIFAIFYFHNADFWGGKVINVDHGSA